MVICFMTQPDVVIDPAVPVGRTIKSR